MQGKNTTSSNRKSEKRSTALKCRMLRLIGTQSCQHAGLHNRPVANNALLYLELLVGTVIPSWNRTLRKPNFSSLVRHWRTTSTWTMIGSATLRRNAVCITLSNMENDALKAADFSLLSRPSPCYVSFTQHDILNRIIDRKANSQHSNYAKSF